MTMGHDVGTGDGVAAPDMALVRVLHERDYLGVKTRLALYESADGSRVYGVDRDGTALMRGTKAEAKAFYGNWRKL